MRVHELAKSLRVTSKDLMATLKALRIPAKSHASTLDADAVNRVRKAVAAEAKKAAARPKPPARPTVIVKRPIAPAGPVAPPARPAAPARAPEPGTRTATVAPPAPAKPAAPPKVKQEKPAKPKPAPRVEEPVPAVPAGPPKQLQVQFPVTVKDLATKMDVKAGDLIKHLIAQGVFASILHPLDQETAAKAAQAFNCELAPAPTPEEELLKTFTPDPAKLKPRAPVVTFMGHVDHGKTSLLDAIREAKVAEREAGGITQHIGAYEVELPKGRVTFLDTPGHEAFSALRARGANITDVVVLVVAADDGVMPQTIEAIDHAKAANVPIVVAINKIDLPDANPTKVKQQLTQHGFVSEEWGGKTITVGVSAKNRQGIDQLLEMLLLEAELLELKGDPTMPATGAVIEARKTKDRGSVATLLVQQGTLRVGAAVLVGHVVGRVRALVNDRGLRIKEAGPGMPVEILGLPDVPRAGDTFHVVQDEQAARRIAEARAEARAEQAARPKRITLEQLHQRITEGKLKELRLILKADVQGSLEAIQQSLQKLDTEKTEVQFRTLHTGVGDINESDVILAAASDAIVVGFHVGIDPRVQVLAAQEGVDIHLYTIIYELVGAIKAAIEGLLEPTVEETFIGRAEVRKLFQISKVGMVAGCMVVKGAVRRDATFRVIRGSERIFEGKPANLKRVKDDVREVAEGTECGISLEGDVDLQVGDLVEAWELKKVARKLN